MSKNNGKDAHGPIVAKAFHIEPAVPEGSDRRAFLMRSALASAIVMLTGRAIPASAQTPAASHTIGPMRITYDFYHVAMANVVAVSGKSEADVNAFLDEIATAMTKVVKSGLHAPASTLPGPIKLKTKAGEVYKRAKDNPGKETSEGGLAVSVVLC